jgi:hypothetical protein
LYKTIWLRPGVHTVPEIVRDDPERVAVTSVALNGKEFMVAFISPVESCGAVVVMTIVLFPVIDAVFPTEFVIEVAVKVVLPTLASTDV